MPRLILILGLITCAAVSGAQTEAWPQKSRYLDRSVWYSKDRPVTDSMVLLNDDKTSAFWILKHEVVNKQYLEFVDYTLHKPPLCDIDMEDSFGYSQIHAWRGRTYPPGMGANPVTFVSLEDAQAFCKWRTEVTGILHRLPTPAEWAVASGQRRYPWGDTVDSLMSISAMRHIQVGPDPFYAYTDDVTPAGLKHMLGNVSEITYDPMTGDVVICGQCYTTPASMLSLQNHRRAVKSYKGSYTTGFRYVIPADENGMPQYVAEQRKVEAH
ncbi:MAG: formylglycine-generating enzyme family protein [Anaerolineales bacterium]|nr:formylglycine-generating enzyme family protein [Anaerolineales bacterium]